MKLFSSQKTVIFVLSFFTLLALYSSQSFATATSNDESGLPLWEVGLGAGVIHQPYYTGTKQTRIFAFPAVFPVYRSKVLKSDDEGIRAQLFKNERLKLDMSVDFNLAIDSDDIDLRQGMDDIDNVLQLGPSFELLLTEKQNSRWYLNLPIRAVLEVGGDGVDSAGFNISPILFYQRDLNFLNSHWVAGASVGPQFGTSDYHNIYYGVDNRFETAERNAFDASGGYSGSRLQLILKSKDQKRFILWFLRYENIDGARFDNSPLIETDHNLTVGFLYTHNFFKSKRKVQ